MHKARQLWIRLETINAVTYFSPESMAAAKSAGLKGFWMGYFGLRAAPMGPVSAGVVQATFANFAAPMVRRAIPDAWSFADPVDLLDVRSGAAAAAIDRLAPSARAVADSVNALLQNVVPEAEPLGRPLFAANARLTLPDDPVARLWQLATTLREHRGDGHVALLAGEGVSGVQSHQLLIAERGLPAELFLKARGFTPGDWDAAHRNLVDRGLLDAAGALTSAGVELRNRIEHRTDELAWQPFRALTDIEVEIVLEQLDRPLQEIRATGEIPAENPMGLPADIS